MVGQSLGQHPSGASYKILSLIGYGAKIVDLYTFGPSALFSNGWSENIAAYPAIAEAMRLVGRTERVLHPGRPERGKVAILLPLASRLWDGDPIFHWKFYQQEPAALHHALVHSGYTVDFVDDTDLEGGELISRGYTTLYITGPNVSALAQKKALEWVQNHYGTLAVTLGAAVADEYNTPTSTLDPVLGIGELGNGVGKRVAERGPWSEGGAPVTGTLAFSDSAICAPLVPTFGAGQMELVGPVLPLKPEGATVVASLSMAIPGGKTLTGAGITAHNFGNGIAIAYGFFPGVQYGYSSDLTDPQRLPLRWDKALRDMAVAAVRLAKMPTTRPVLVSQEVVEACKLQSDQGIAVVLLNWTDEPIDSLDVTVPAVGHFQRVSSAQDGPLKSTASTVSVSGKPPVTTVTVKNMRLKDVDVLLFE